MSPVIGIDFGTTNSVVAIRQGDGRVETLRFGTADVFRSLLCFWSEAVGGAPRHAAGQAAIEAYLDDPLGSRLIMSMKSYLAQRSLGETQLFGRRYPLEALIALFLRELTAGLGPEYREAALVVGRPIHFVGETADDALGETRLRAAFANAGFPRITIGLEPEAAGFRFARELAGEATVLIGDFGGGTSDFSILRYGGAGTQRVTALGHAGVGIAGDAFDYRIIDRVVSPLLGKGDTYRVLKSELPVPPSYFTSFARWHRLSLMRAPRTLRDIAEVARTAAHPERLRHLIQLIEDEAGYALYQAVSAAKLALTAAESAVLRFRHRGFVVEQEIARADFEGWIAPELGRFGTTIDAALASAGLRPEQIDQVFLTGGTSLVPAVRRLFEQRFGPAKVIGGGEFVSVAEGLALMDPS